MALIISAPKFAWSTSWIEIDDVLFLYWNVGSCSAWIRGRKHKQRFILLQAEEVTIYAASCFM